MRQFGDGVGEVAARMDDLEQRFDALTARVATGKPKPLRR
jgi:hypothetical protein